MTVGVRQISPGGISPRRGCRCSCYTSPEVVHRLGKCVAAGATALTMSALTLGVVSHHPGLHRSTREDQDARVSFPQWMRLVLRAAPEQLSQFQRNMPLDWIEEALYERFPSSALFPLCQAWPGAHADRSRPSDQYPEAIRTCRQRGCPPSKKRIRMHEIVAHEVRPCVFKKSSSSLQIWSRSSSVSFNKIFQRSGSKKRYTRPEQRRSVDDGCQRNRWCGWSSGWP